MIYDGINLLEGSEIVNLTVPTGTSYPLSPNAGELFFRTDAPNVGLYTYNGTAWVSAGSGGGASTLDELSDTIITTPANGQVLKYNGTNWVNSTDSVGTGTVTSVAATQPTKGFTISGSPITSNGTLTFTLANDLAALENLSGTGYAKRTGTDTWVVDASLDMSPWGGLSSATIVTTSTAQTVVDTFPATYARCVEYLIQTSQSGTYYATKILIVQDGTNIPYTEYGQVGTTGSHGTFTADINAGDVRLLFAANLSTSTMVKVVRLSILV